MATTRTRQRGTLPPVEVECPECGHRWSSTAQRHTPVHCARCGHSIRVKREPGAQAAVIAANTPQPRAVAPAVIRPANVAPASAAQVMPQPSRPVPLPSPGEDADDDGETWLYDDHGVLVLGEWTWDGRLIPVSPASIDRSAGLAVRGWQLRPNPEGPARCYVNLPPPPGAPIGTDRHHCLGLALHVIPGGVICDSCLDALSHAVTI
jgi:ribosomal protein S27E